VGRAVLLATVGEWARQDAALTHPHPVCQQANALFAMATAQVVKTGPSPEDLYQQMVAWAVDPTLLGAIRGVASGPPAEYVERQGLGLVDTVMRGDERIPMPWSVGLCWGRCMGWRRFRPNGWSGC
jgi:hypothetical protein